MCKKIAKTSEIYQYKLGDVTRSKNLLLANGESVSLGRGFFINLEIIDNAEMVRCVLTGNNRIQHFSIEPKQGDLLILNHWCGLLLQIRALVFDEGAMKMLASFISIDGTHGPGDLSDVLLLSSVAYLENSHVVH